MKKKTTSWQKNVAVISFFLEKRGHLIAKILNQKQESNISFTVFIKLLSFAAKHPKHSYRLLQLFRAKEYKKSEFLLQLLHDDTVQNFIKKYSTTLAPYAASLIGSKIPNIPNKEKKLEELAKIILKNISTVIPAYDRINANGSLSGSKNIKEFFEFIKANKELQEFITNNKTFLSNIASLLIKIDQLPTEIKDLVASKDDNLKILLAIILNNLLKVIQIYDYYSNKEYPSMVKEIFTLIKDDSNLQQLMLNNNIIPLLIKMNIPREIIDLLTQRDDNFKVFLAIILNNLSDIIKMYDYYVNKQYSPLIKEIFTLIKDDSNLQQFIRDNKDFLSNKIIAKLPWLSNYGIDQNTFELIVGMMANQNKMNSLINLIDQCKDLKSLSKNLHHIRTIGIPTVGCQLLKTGRSFIPPISPLAGLQTPSKVLTFVGSTMYSAYNTMSGICSGLMVWSGIKKTTPPPEKHTSTNKKKSK